MLRGSAFVSCPRLRFLRRHRLRAPVFALLRVRAAAFEPPCDLVADGCLLPGEVSQPEEDGSHR